jgi:EAL domain-containing protein (putative c-di-GMP-specific phosphodiesterase class I)
MKRFIEQSSSRIVRLYVVCFAVTIVFILNMLLIHLLHLKTHQQGIEIVKQVHFLDEHNRTSENVSQIAKKYGFDSADNVVSSNGAEQEVFSYKELSLTLSHPTIIQNYFGILVFFNVLFVGFFMFGYRWLLIYRVRPSFLHSKSTDICVENNAALPTSIEPRRPDKSLFCVFALVKWHYVIDSMVDPQQHFSVILAKHFSDYAKCSVKYLSSGALTVTFEQVPWSDVSRIEKKLHEVVFQALVIMRPDLSRKTVKIGACYYQARADQTQVYQLARSALAVALHNVWQHVHMVPLNKTHATAIQSSESDFINYINKGQFVLFFQPLFCFKQQDIMQSEALLRVRHDQLGLISAKQFIPQIYSKNHLNTLDKAVIAHTLRVLRKEPEHTKVSINLHYTNWCDKSFIDWLVEEINKGEVAHRVQFEVSSYDYYHHHRLLLSAFSTLAKSGAGVLLDQVTDVLPAKILRAIPVMASIKLAYELVHNIDSNHSQQRSVRQIVRQAERIGVPVYAVGVETQAELYCLQQLGVQGAQGYYYAELLQQIELVGY